MNDHLPGEEDKPSRLTARELARYDRQLLFPGFGEQGQERLKRARALVVGAGGLGSPAAIYLACAGIGHLQIVDFEAVELSNLNRQILHWEQDVAKKKTVSASRKLTGMNSDITVEPLCLEVAEENAADLVAGADVVLDCLDNMRTRFILNRACHQKKVPLIHAGVNGVVGEVTTIIPGETPCLECLFPPHLEKKGKFPIFGATAGLIASLQCLEAIKLLSGVGKLLNGRMLYVDGGNMDFTVIPIDRRKDCRVCGQAS